MISSLKLNNIDLSTLSEQQLKQLCAKYKIIPNSELVSIDKNRLLNEVKSYLTYKMNNYKGRRRSMSGPTMSGPTIQHLVTKQETVDRVIINEPKQRRTTQN